MGVYPAFLNINHYNDLYLPALHFSEHGRPYWIKVGIGHNANGELSSVDIVISCPGTVY